MSRRTVWVVALLVAGYVASYLWLSRRGYEQADEWHCVGFFYFTPEPTDAWRLTDYPAMYALTTSASGSGVSEPRFVEYYRQAAEMRPASRCPNGSKGETAVFGTQAALAVVGAQLRPTSLNVCAAFTTRRLGR